MVWDGADGLIVLARVACGKDGGCEILRRNRVVTYMYFAYERFLSHVKDNGGFALRPQPPERLLLAVYCASFWGRLILDFGIFYFLFFIIFVNDHFVEFCRIRKHYGEFAFV